MRCLRRKACAALRRVPTPTTQQRSRTLHEHSPGAGVGTTSGAARSTGALYVTAYASSATHAESATRATVLRLRPSGGPAAPLCAAVIVQLVRACAAWRCSLHEGWTGACCAQRDVSFSAYKQSSHATEPAARPTPPSYLPPPHPPPARAFHICHGPTPRADEAPASERRCPKLTTWSAPCSPTTWRTWSAAPSCRVFPHLLRAARRQK